ncbi:MAG: hypothetical protein ACRC7O_08120, partial [Fimbriiglobus sp.]
IREGQLGNLYYGESGNLGKHKLNPGVGLVSGGRNYQSSVLRTLGISQNRLVLVVNEFAQVSCGREVAFSDE